MLALGVWSGMAIDYQQLVDDINAALQGIAQEGFALSTPDELPPLGAYTRATFSILDIQPPSQNYLTRDDGIIVTAWNSVAAVTVEVTGRFLRVDGTMLYIRELLIPTTDRVASTMQRQLGEGFLLNAALKVTGASVLRGQCFAQLSLTQGSGTGQVRTTTLIADYLNAQAPTGWPPGTIVNPLEGAGAFRVIDIAINVGDDIAEAVVPTNARWRVSTALFTFTTSAVVANRLGIFSFVQPATLGFQTWHPTALTASLFGSMFCAQWGTPPATLLQNYSMNLPTLPTLPAGTLIDMGLSFPAAGDTLNAAELVVEEWIDI